MSVSEKIERDDKRVKVIESIQKEKLQKALKSPAALTRAATIAAFILSGIALGEMGRRYGLAHPQKEEEMVSAQVLEETMPEAPSPSQPAQKPMIAQETRGEDPAYKPEPDKLNLVYYYPEGSDTGDIINSYAGQVFQDLTVMDSQWLADIYELADVKPSAMAARLGKSSASARGGYNPKAENHNPDDPSTWTINDWKKIHVSFVNGDGKAMSGYSNVKDILAMASVYTYYTDVMDVETFEAYAKQLWKDSHGYSLSMGDVYYCDGCMDKTDEEIALEEELEETDLSFVSADANRVIADSSEAGASDGTDAASREGSDQPAASEASRETSVRTIYSGKNYRGGSSSAEHSAEDQSSSEETSTSDAETANTDEANQGSDAAPASNAGTSSGTAAEESSISLSETDASDDSTASAQTESSSTALAEGNGEVTVIRRNVAAQAAEREAAMYSSPSDPNANASRSDAEMLSSQEEQTASSQADTAQTDSASQNGSEGAKEGEDQSVSSRQAQGRSGSTRTSRTSETSKSSHSNCPGHIDLYIRIRLSGLEDAKGLVAKDTIGNNPENQSEHGWKGWTEENLGHALAICQQDWFADYGLSISAISTSTPLTAQEIDDYMSKLPDDLSETRRKIIHFALSSVGRVPYYWGGKASHAGYEGNNFGMLISADDKGRMLRGLDCSGWISWVYWSVTGQQLSGSSTSSLILCGEKISRSQLQPGDIIVRTGTNAHVVMFLGWSANGQMNVIHESSASVNNVTIKTMEAAWPYYRKLVD